MLDENNVDNYLTMELIPSITHTGIQKPIRVTVQWMQRKSPEELLGEKLERIAELEAELAAAKDPWIYIDQERPEKMPPCCLDILLTRQDGMVVPGERDELRIYDSYTGLWEPIENYTHWQPWPDPAPQKETP
jgi:hypothetical protein